MIFVGDLLAALLEELCLNTLTSDKTPKFLRYIIVIILIGLLIFVGISIFLVLS